MALSRGTRLGPYEILQLLGAGGMGEVYKARDTRLDRTVAVKVLQDDLAADSLLKARFEREARAISALTHPNICTLHDVGEEDGHTFLVMEHLDGQPLDVRLKKGPLPLEQALEVAIQIGDALSAAHKQGIVHRDLKPGNVMLTKTGARLLDFGLARLIEHGEQAAVKAESAVPTEAVPLTGVGMVMGTLPYMAPEQVEGKEADPRTDLWALGLILYEMLTGARAFEAQSPTSLVGAILEREPAPLKERLPLTPPSLDRLVRRCLAKDPDERWDTAHDVADQLRWIAESELDAEAHTEAGGRVGWIAKVLGAVAVTSLVALGLVLVFLVPGTGPAPAPVRLEVKLGSSLALGGHGAAVLSPDGRRLAFLARESDGASRLYIRALDQLEARALPGTEGARSPFFSPDGQWIAFFSREELRKIAVAGGAAVTVVDVPDPRGGSWGPDDAIVFGHRSSAGFGLQRVSSSGGEVETLTTPNREEGEVNHRWPQVLGDGRILYTVGNAPLDSYEDASLVIETFPDGPRKVVHRGGYFGRYLSSGHLVFIRQDTLFAAPFDLERMEKTDTAVPVVEAVRANALGGVAQFSFSDDGTLVYVPRGRLDFPIHWLSRGGTPTPLRAEPAPWKHADFSPDGNRLVMALRDGPGWNLWIYGWARDTLTRLTFEPEFNYSRPVFAPDGRRVAFSSTRAGKGFADIYWRESDGSGEVVRLTDGDAHQYVTSWHPSGRFLTFQERGPTTAMDVWVLEIETEGEGRPVGAPRPFVMGPFGEAEGAFSPDGRFLAYSSLETGRSEVFVRSFPGPGGKWQITTDGGEWATWSRARSELLYETVDRRIMVVPYTVERNSFRAERPRPWSYERSTGEPRPSFALHPDGERVAMRLDDGTSQETPDSVVIVFNFSDEIRRLTSAGGQ